VESIQRIAIVGPAYPLRGGIAAFNEHLALAFIEQGKEVAIWSFRYQYPKFLFPGKSQIDNQSEKHDALRIEPIIHSVNPFNWFRSARRIKKQNPDVVIVRYWMPFMAPCLGVIASILRRSGIKVIAITDNVIPHERMPFDVALARFFIRRCDAFVTMSQTVANDLVNLNPDAIFKVLPHPIYNQYGQAADRDSARRKLQIGEEPVFLFFGLIRKYKGLDLLLKALASVAATGYQFTLLVAGEFYDSESDYRKLTAELGLNAHVRFYPDYISNEEVKFFFGAADLVVQPYRNATQSGITQIAYHFNKPCLVTNVGGLSEIVAHDVTGLVCEPDVDSIAGAIKGFLDSGNFHRFDDDLAVYKKRFEWGFFTEGLIELASQVQQHTDRKN
jgi:glycosyltransferase involved in cell wall biosynthesis